MYQCVATSVAGFVQQLAVGYVAHGYYFYVTGVIPKHKDPAKIDEKILRKYEIAVSRWTRARRKTAGLANVHYLRYGHFFVILANHGEHQLFVEEAKRLRDIRKRPILFHGYSIGCRRERGGGKYHASVRINRDLYLERIWEFDRIAVNCSIEQLCQALRGIPFEPYAPVRDQLRGLLRVINRRRKIAGLESVPREALRLRRAPVRPFAASEQAATDHPSEKV